MITGSSLIIVIITVCLIPEDISDLDGLIPEVNVAGVALCGEVWLKPLINHRIFDAAANNDMDC